MKSNHLSNVIKAKKLNNRIPRKLKKHVLGTRLTKKEIKKWKEEHACPTCGNQLVFSEKEITESGRQENIYCLRCGLLVGVWSELKLKNCWDYNSYSEFIDDIL